MEWVGKDTLLLMILCVTCWFVVLHEMTGFLTGVFVRFGRNLRRSLDEARAAVQEVDAQMRQLDGQVRAARAEVSAIDTTIRDLTSKLQLKRRELNDLKNQEEPEESFVVSLVSGSKVGIKFSLVSDFFDSEALSCGSRSLRM